MLVSDDRPSSELLLKKPIAARYPPTIPTTAPVNASAPAVVAVIARRVLPPAPVADSVRRSRAASLRTRPTLRPRMPIASTIPNSVAASMICASDGMLLRVSTPMPAAAAIR